jgi:hypothetical protein
MLNPVSPPHYTWEVIMGRPDMYHKKLSSGAISKSRIINVIPIRKYRNKIFGKLWENSKL